MFNKWQIVLLGMAVSQGAGLSAMENQPTNSLRNSQDCAREVAQESVLLEVLKKRAIERKPSSGELSKGDLSKEEKLKLEEKKALFNMPLDTPCGYGRSWDYWSYQRNPMESKKPWGPRDFPH